MQQQLADAAALMAAMSPLDAAGAAGPVAVLPPEPAPQLHSAFCGVLSRIFVPFALQRILYLSCRGLSKTAVELSVTTDYKYNTGSLPQLRGRAICCDLRWLVLGGRGQSWRQSPSARATQGGPWCGCPSSHIRQPASLRLAAADVVAAAQPSGPPVTCPACCPADDEGEEVDAATSMANEMDL